MNDQSTYLVRAVSGPVILITVGVLFAFDKFTEFHFRQTWPVLLIVIGLLKLAGGRARGRFGYPPPPPPPPGGDPRSSTSPPYGGPGERP
jgi:hypothetical protein